MTESNLNNKGDAGDGRRPRQQPPPEDVYGATISDGVVGPTPPPLRSGQPPEGDVYGATFADAGAESSSPVLGGEGRVAARDVYKLVHLLGKGGMGEVNLAWDRRLHRWVALKRLLPQSVGDSRLLKRFWTEARSVGALSHFHIVRIHEMDEDEEGPYIAMEYVAGPTPGTGSDWPPDAPNPPLNLEEQVQQQGVLDVPEAVQLGVKLCSAIRYAHKRGVIHRDIKPANILIDEEAEPKLADFGLARQANTEEEGMTMVGAQMGTPIYSPPEQITDASQADERADIYALGNTLWFALTAQSPRYFRESEVPLPLRSVLVKALQKDREKRFQTAGELEQALAKLDPHAKFAPPVDHEGPVPGLCPECGHQDPLDQQGASNRKFCENCGVALVEPCLKCGGENGVWAKFCGPCGADLTGLVQTALSRLKAEREEILVMQNSYRFAQAIRRLDKIMKNDHPRLREFSKWAEQTLPQVRAALAGAERQRDKKYEEAESLVTMCEYKEAVPLLDSVPDLLRTEELNKLLDRARHCHVEVRRLRREIRAQIAAKQYDGLKEKATELLQLRPNDEQVQNLLKQLEQREVQQHENLWQAAARGGTIAGYRQYLATYPGGSHVEEARALLAPPLREQVLLTPRDVDLRKEYLQARTEELSHEDEQLALRGAAICSAISGAIGGALIGVLAGAVGGVLGGAIGGIIGGVIGGIILER